MADAFYSEISLFGFNFAPRDWSTCDGQILPTSQNPALFSLIGGAFGGNGQSSFALPQLQGRVAVSSGFFTAGPPISYLRGAAGGTPYVTLSTAQLPAHTHEFYATTDEGDFAGNLPKDLQLATGEPGKVPLYGPSSGLTQLNEAAISSAGGGQSHYNVQPYQAVLFCICTDGVYPSRN